MIVVKDLKKNYNGLDVLKGIDLTINKGDVVCLVGPSGCGKSTFLKTMNRMQDLVPGVKIEGDLFFRGQDVNSKDVDVTELRRQIAQLLGDEVFSIV